MTNIQKPYVSLTDYIWPDGAAYYVDSTIGTQPDILFGGYWYQTGTITTSTGRVFEVWFRDDNLTPASNS